MFTLTLNSRPSLSAKHIDYAFIIFVTNAFYIKNKVTALNHRYWYIGCNINVNLISIKNEILNLTN